jgi:hypothetical protein
MKRTSWILLFALLGSGSTEAQQQTSKKPEAVSQESTAAASSQKKPLTIEGITTMLSAGVSEEIIITKIRREGQAFDLSPDEIVKLKKAGFTDRLVMVMMDPVSAPPPASVSAVPASSPVVLASPAGPVVVSGGTSSSSGATPAAGTSPTATSASMHDPEAPHDSGIYLHTTNREGQKVMISLERAAYQGGKTGARFLSQATGGLIKEKWKAVIPGERASIRAVEPRPVFYFYFEDKSAALGKSQFGGQAVSNPNQFSLVELEVKKTSRETIIGEQGSLGASSGTHAKSMRAFKSEKVRPGVYRVTPIDNLESGEYCFFAAGATLYSSGNAGAAGAVDIFDFGVSSAE